MRKMKREKLGARMQMRGSWEVKRAKKRKNGRKGKNGEQRRGYSITNH